MGGCGVICCGQAVSKSLATAYRRRERSHEDVACTVGTNKFDGKRRQDDCCLRSLNPNQTIASSGHDNCWKSP